MIKYLVGIAIGGILGFIGATWYISHIMVQPIPADQLQNDAPLQEVQNAH